MRWTDYLLLTLLILLLCGYDAISGRPLTLHEARLPQTSREMMQSGNWLVPTSGGRPWLERPPLPHWVMIAVAYATGTHCDTEWSVRIAPGLMALVIVLLTARIAAGFFGRGMGVASGCILATMFEFYRYATLAEDDIFLGAVVMAAMAMFVQMEFAADPDLKNRRISFFGWRPWPVILFCILLGLTNLAKGPIVGAAVVVGAIGVYLLWQQDWSRLRRYLWLWGMLACAAIALSWHLWIQHKFPEYWKNLRYDFNDTEEFDQPFWYYPVNLLGLTMPWAPPAVLGLALTAKSAWRDKNPVMRFLWCWAIVPIIVLSIPHRKHHHYLVPSLAPWAIFAAIGAKAVAEHFFNDPAWRRTPKFGLLVYGLPGTIALIILIYRHIIPCPTAVAAILVLTWIACVWIYFHGLTIEKPGWLLAAVVIGVGMVLSWGQRYWPNADVPDTQFLRKVESEIPHDKLLTINAAVGPLDFFRLQFYLRPDALLLHNLTYLQSDQIHSPDAFIVGRARDLGELNQYGTADEIFESVHTRSEKSPADRFALFHITFRPDLQRYPPPAVSPMQAMQREAGPICGPSLP